MKFVNKFMKNTSFVTDGGGRNSNLELFRIITMLIIVAHHYVVNSGLVTVINEHMNLTWNNIFLILFGWGGKTGINCFVLITGYFMCKSEMKWSKFYKLLCEVLFYNFVIYFAFFIIGYQPFAMKDFILTIFPFSKITTNFTACFLLFYLFIPFLNRLIHHLDEKEHLTLIGLLLFTYTVVPSFLKGEIGFNYITWFIVLYFLSAYIRMYPREIFSKTKFWGIMSIACVLTSWLSVLILFFVGGKMGKTFYFSYFFVSDSNKILALITAVCTFLFFKNVKIKQSKIINTISASTFGVLLIHANSDTMRRWLWQDTLHNTEMYDSPYLVLHAVLSVVVVFFVCVIVDYFRIHMLRLFKLRRKED